MFSRLCSHLHWAHASTASRFAKAAKLHLVLLLPPPHPRLEERSWSLRPCADMKDDERLNSNKKTDNHDTVVKVTTAMMTLSFSLSLVFLYHEHQ